MDFSAVNGRRLESSIVLGWKQRDYLQLMGRGKENDKRMVLEVGVGRRTAIRSEKRKRGRWSEGGVGGYGRLMRTTAQAGRGRRENGTVITLMVGWAESGKVALVP
jgi:hypothetical protein